MSLLEQIKEISGQIQSTKDGLEALTEKVENIERTSLRQALKISSGNLLYETIASSAAFHNCSSCIHKANFTFTDKKGICLASASFGSEDPYGENIDERELWLLDSGDFITTHRNGYKSIRENEWWSWSRTITATDVDPVESDFDVKEILQNLVSHLEDRLSDLSCNIKDRRDRIEELSSVDLH